MSVSLFNQGRKFYPLSSSGFGTSLTNISLTNGNCLNKAPCSIDYYLLDGSSSIKLSVKIDVKSSYYFFLVSSFVSS